MLEGFFKACFFGGVGGNKPKTYRSDVCVSWSPFLMHTCVMWALCMILSNVEETPKFTLPLLQIEARSFTPEPTIVATKTFLDLLILIQTCPFPTNAPLI